MKTPVIILALAALSLAQTTPYSLHLPDALPAPGDALVADSNIHYDDDETTVLLKWAAPEAPAPADAPTVTVFSESPGLRSSDFTGRSLWTLAHVPTPNGLACYANGLRQTPGVEYFSALNGAIVSRVWKTTDTILCDYYYAKAAQ